MTDKNWLQNRTHLKKQVKKNELDDRNGKTLASEVSHPSDLSLTRDSTNLSIISLVFSVIPTDPMKEKLFKAKHEYLLQMIK
jgi:hypothetical protein